MRPASASGWGTPTVDQRPPVLGIASFIALGFGLVGGAWFGLQGWSFWPPLFAGAVLFASVVVLYAVAQGPRGAGRFARMRWWGWLVLTLALAAVLWLLVVLVPWTVPGQVAQRIRDAGSPLVTKVTYRDRDWLWSDPPYVAVDVLAGLTQAQADALWCQVIVPAGGSRSTPPDDLTTVRTQLEVPRPWPQQAQEVRPGAIC